MCVWEGGGRVELGVGRGGCPPWGCEVAKKVSESLVSCNLEPSAWKLGMVKGLGKLDPEMSKGEGLCTSLNVTHSHPDLEPLGDTLFHVSEFSR